MYGDAREALSSVNFWWIVLDTPHYRSFVFITLLFCWNFVLLYTTSHDH